MKKIGICTFYNNNNYGSYLQAFALKSFLCQKGCETHIIDFTDYTKPWNRKLRNKTICSRVRCLLLHPKLLIETIKAKFISNQSIICSNEQREKFHFFYKKYLCPYSGNFLDESFSYFIVGSDQVWKVSMPGLHQVFFLRFCSPSKRISYAASLGAETIPRYNKKQLYKYLKEFKAISVREKATVSLLNQLESGIQSTLVLDPVLLVGDAFWKRYIKPNKAYQYVFMYFLDDVNEYEIQIGSLLERYPDCKIFMVDTGVRFPKLTNVEYIKPDPFEFVSYIHNSLAVVTDSFHGTAFSILLNREFYVYPRHYKIYSGQSARIYSLLELFQCKERLIYSTTDTNNIPSLNWRSINDIMSQMREISSVFLNKSVE